MTRRTPVLVGIGVPKGRWRYQNPGEEGAHFVQLEVRMQNQLSDVTADGTSIVELPTRSRT